MFQRSADQELLADTTRRFIEAEWPLTSLRAMADSKTGYEAEVWRRGAELGWTSLLVPEGAGGGAVSDNPVLDLALVAYEFGLHASPGPLLPANVVAAALGRWGNEEQQARPLQALLAGEQVATWALAEPAPNDGIAEIELSVREEGGGYRLSGVKSPVEAAATADHLLVTARHGPGLSQFLVPRDSDGMTVDPLQALDMTRRFARVELDDVRLEAGALVGLPGQADDAVAWLFDLTVALQLAEMVGTMQWGFDTTLEWAQNRYSFGRPLASYQEIKHRFADMKTWLEASYAITAAAAEAVATDGPDRSTPVSAGKFYLGHHGGELLQDCVQLHGGIGVTFDHDLHLFLRRLSTDMALFGTPAQHCLRLTAILETQDDQAQERAEP